MGPGLASKVVACTLGLAGFAVATVAGLYAQNEADVILLRAIVSMLGCQAVGFVIGMVGERAVSERIGSHRIENPAPDVGDGVEELMEGVGEPEEASRSAAA